MGIAGKGYVLVQLCCVKQTRGHVDHAATDRAQLVTQPQLEVYKHLVIPGTTRMDTLANVAKTLNKPGFNLRVYVFDTFVNGESVTVDLRKQVAQRSHDLCTVVSREQSYGDQHVGMGNASDDVPSGQTHVHVAVSANRKLLHQGVDRRPFIPKLHCLLLKNARQGRSSCQCRTPTPAA